MEGSVGSRSSLIGVVTAPLGFFALSLLIVEGFLTISLIYSGLDAGGKFWGMMIGTGLFILVVVGVFVLVWCKPTNLTFGESSHLRAMFGTSENPEPRSKIVEHLPGAPPSNNLGGGSD